VDPRPYAVNSIKEAFELYPHLGPVLPAMGYGDHQIQDLAETIRRVPCDAILIATPVDLRRLMDLPKPATRVRYELQEIGHPTLEEVLRDLL
jgi:predicted GTPase